MNRFVIIATCTAAILFAAELRAAEWRELSILVEDDLGEPVGGASVRGLLANEQVREEAFGRNVSGFTNGEGRVDISVLEGLSVDFSVEKDGFYQTLHRVSLRDRDRKKLTGAEVIRLRKRIDPVAMYAKRVLFLVKGLEHGEKYGYDFLRGDFVAPVGEGVTKDVEFSYVREFIDNQNWRWTLDVRFMNPTDGLISHSFDRRGSAFRSDYAAPADGYRIEWSVSESRGYTSPPSGVLPDPNEQGFYFRVRTELDDKGNVIGGYYGKMYGGLPESAYYLNPNRGDRNVEWDTSQNLFGRLPTLERAGEP